MQHLELIKKIFEILGIILDKVNVKIWLTILTFVVSFILAVQFAPSTFLKPKMKDSIQKYKSQKHKIEKILEETMLIIAKDRKGIAILEVIPTENQGTITNPNYWGYVSHLVEYNSIEKKVVNTLETRLKVDKINIPYDYLVSKKIHLYATDLNEPKPIYLSVNEMINKIDPKKMEAMWRTKTQGENGKLYYGNFDFEVEGGIWAFAVDKGEVVLQIILLIDKEFYDNNHQNDYLKHITQARNEIQKVFE